MKERTINIQCPAPEIKELDVEEGTATIGPSYPYGRDVAVVAMANGNAPMLQSAVKDVKFEVEYE